MVTVFAPTTTMFCKLGVPGVELTAGVRIGAGVSCCGVGAIGFGWIGVTFGAAGTLGFLWMVEVFEGEGAMIGLGRRDGWLWLDLAGVTVG